jgi:predicted DNA-binding transcriptional regulator AlpA
MMELLDQREVAEITGESTRTWERRRATGEGPAYYQLGRLIRYDRDEVLEWIKLRRRRSTSEPADWRSVDQAVGQDSQAATALDGERSSSVASQSFSAASQMTLKSESTALRSSALIQQRRL